jgi:hypothetical protein
MLVTGVTGVTWTVTRGAESTSASSHAAGTAVVAVLTAGGLDELRAEIEAEIQRSSVDTLANLIALTNVGFGQKFRVESVGRSYEFTPSGVSPLSDVVVINSALGQWHSLEGTSDQKWLSQSTWYVDAIAGNDENSGVDVSHPLKSTDEIQRRWGTNPTIAIYVTINLINAPDIINLSLSRSTDIAGLLIQGITTDVVTTTVGVYTAKSDSTNKGYDLTCPGVSDWTPYVGLRVLANGNAVSWVRKVSPEGSGITHAGVTAFYRSASFGLLTTPTTGQALLVQQLPTCSSMFVFVKSGRENDAASVGFTSAITVMNVAVTKRCTLNAPAGIANIQLFGCDIVDLSLYPQGAGTYAIACRERYAQVLIPQHYAYGVLFDKSTYTPNTQYRVVTSDSFTMEWVNCTWSQIGIQLATVNAIFIQGCQAFDWPTSAGGALELPDGASVFLVGGFSGSSANSGTYGIKVRPTCSILYNTLTAYIAGASGEILCVGVGSFLWADKPLYWGQRMGSSTLVAGTKTIVSKNMPADVKIMACYNTPAGTPGNKLSVPQASRTNLGTATSQFIVNSDNAGDTSTFDWTWVSLSIGPGGMFSH